MADIKAVWKPRTWHFRGLATNDMESFEGTGWVPGKNCICFSPPVKVRTTFPASVATNHTVSTAFNFLNSINLEHYVITHYAPGNVGNQTIAKVVMPSTYAAFTGLSNIVPMTWPSLVMTASSTIGYITTQTHGLIKLTFGAVTMAQVTSATTMHKVVRHLSRLIGIASDNNYSRVKWSKSGDFDDWTGTGSGSVDFILDNGTLEDIFVVNNVVVVLGSNSIHHGYLTGLAETPYRWEEVANNTDVMAPGSHAVRDANTIYFSGNAGIYKYENLQQIRLDNLQLSNLLGDQVNFGYNLFIYWRLRERGFNGLNDRVIEAKHLACIPQSPTLSPLMYLFDDGQWYPYLTKDRYNNDTISEETNSSHGTVVSVHQRGELTGRSIQFIKANKVRTLSNDDNPNEYHSHLLISPAINLAPEGEPEEFVLDRILVKYAVKDGSYTVTGDDDNYEVPCTIGVLCTHGYSTLGTGSLSRPLFAEGNQRLRQQWWEVLNSKISGQFFQLIINFGYNQHAFDLLEVEMHFLRAGDVHRTAEA